MANFKTFQVYSSFKFEKIEVTEENNFKTFQVYSSLQDVEKEYKIALFQNFSSL